MPLTLTPVRLPTLEPVKAALALAITTDIRAALDLMETRFPVPAIALPSPEAVIQKTVQDYQQIAVWPTVTLTGWNGRVERASEGHTGNQWLGEIEIRVFLRAARLELDTMLDRYLTALWLVAINQELYGTAFIDTGSMAFEQSEPAGGSVEARAGRLTFNVRWRV